MDSRQAVGRSFDTEILKWFATVIENAQRGVAGTSCLAAHLSRVLMESQPAVRRSWRPSGEGLFQTLHISQKWSPNRQPVGQRRRWESNPLRTALQAAASPSGSGVDSAPARNRTWSASIAGSRANPAHSEDITWKVARPGIEPGPTASEAGMRSGTPTGRIVNTPTWTRTRTKTLGGSRAVCYTTGMEGPARAFLSRAKPSQSKGVTEGSRTLTSCFTGRRAYRVHHGHRNAGRRHQTMRRPRHQSR
jgi:hypothetical protein